MFKRNKKVKIQTYLRTSAGDIESSPWEINSMLTPMLAPNWFKAMAPKVEVENKIKTATPSSLLREAHDNSGAGGLCRTLRTCPSFINMLTTGYVIQNKMDAVVRYENNDVQFHTFTDPSNRVIDTHSIDQFSDQFPFQDGFSKFSLKFMNEWALRSDTDVTLLILPCWWDTTYNDVRALHGMVNLPANFDWNPHLNTFIRIPKEGEEYLIPAGAPIAHIIPVNLADVSFSHNQELAEDAICKRTRGMIRDISSYSPLSDKLKNIGRMFRVTKGER